MLRSLGVEIPTVEPLGDDQHAGHRCPASQLGGRRGLVLRAPKVPSVWDDDPNPVIGEMFDHRGEVLLLARMEPDRRMGY
jgi:hypothetical protein